MSKTDAKHLQQLKKLATEVYSVAGNYHAITKELLRIYNDNDLDALAKSYSGTSPSTYLTELNKCNLIIDIMDFVKFKDDVFVWRKVANIYQSWADELKEQREQPVEFKTKEELSQNNL